MRGPVVTALTAIASAGCVENLTHPDASAPIACTPNLDGVIDASEFIQLADAHAVVLRSMPGSNPPVDVRGIVDDDGRRTWSLATDTLGTTAHDVLAIPRASRWYAHHFSGAMFAFTSADGAFDSIYSQSSDALWLHGIASTLENPMSGLTLIVYAMPVPVYRFPLARDDAWTATAEIPAGMFNGISFTGRDTYAVTNDASGWLELPELRFTQAHRVRFAVTRQPTIGPAITRRQVSFLFECFGEVARITSRANEPALEFTTAEEVTRLTITGGRY